MTRCIGYAASSPPPTRGSATAVKHGCVVFWMPVTPTGRYAPPGTHGRGIYGSMIHPPQTTSNPRELGRTIARWTPQINPLEGNQRTHRSPQHLSRIAGFRNANYRPRPSLRRETQLGPPRHRHSPCPMTVKAESETDRRCCHGGYQG